MSILIKGMEMPKNCILCPLSVLSGERLFCEVTKDEVLRSKRMSNCPLVPVRPHGRLIDADTCENYFFEHLSDDDMAGAMNAIEEMPTIIPAEEGETW